MLKFVQFLKKPEDPPFTAYFGNLPNGIVQEDVQDMFNKLKVRSICVQEDVQYMFNKLKVRLIHLVCDKETDK